MSRTMDTTTTTVIRKIIGIISISTLFLSTRLQRRPPGEREDDFEDENKYGDDDKCPRNSLRIARLQAKPNPIDGALRLHAAGRSVRWGEYFLYSLEKYCICAPSKLSSYWEILPRCPRDFPRPEGYLEGVDFPITPEFW